MIRPAERRSRGREGCHGAADSHWATRGGASAARTIVAAEQAKRGQRQSHRVDAPRGRGRLVPSVGHQCERQIEGSNTLNAGLPAACGASPWLLGGRAGRGSGRLVGCTGLTRLKGRTWIFLWKTGAQKGRPFKTFPFCFAFRHPFSKMKKKGKSKMMAFGLSAQPAAICPLALPTVGQ